MLRTRFASLLATLLLVLQAHCCYSGGEEACTADSTTCPKSLDDDVDLVQVRTQLNLGKGTMQSAQPQLKPRSHFHGHVRNFRDWGDRVLMATSDFYGDVVTQIVSRWSARRGTALIANSEDVLLDGGEGMPLIPCVAAVSLVLFMGLAMWLYPTTVSAPGKAAAGPLEMRWYHLAALMQLDVMTPITQDSYIPSMPVMARQLNATQSAVGLSLQINWVFSGFIALALGLASDKYGRRPVLLLALTFYVVGGLVAAISPNVECLIFARCIQGIGGGIQALCYAVVRDCVESDDERAKLFSIFSIAATMAIALAPVGGGLAAVVMGWRMVFVLLAAWGMLAFWNVLTLLPETNQHACAEVSEPSANELPRPEGSHFGPIFDVFQKSLKPLGMFVSMWMLMPILMSILASMPFILDNTYGADTTRVFLSMSALAVFSLSGSALCFVLIRIFTAWQVLRLGMFQLLVVGSALLILGMTNMHLTMASFLTLPCFYILSLSTIMGPMRSLIAQPFAEAAGAANGLVMAVGGPLGAVFGFVFTWIFQQWGKSAWMIAIGCAATFHQTSFWGLVGPAAEADHIYVSTQKYFGKGKGKGK